MATMTLGAHAAEARVPGYALGDPGLPRSPVTLDELALIERAALFGEEDAANLRLAGEVLAGQVEEVLDVWYGFVGSHPHLLHYFSGKADGVPNAEYLARVRRRFAKWIEDTTAARYDQAWLDYQHEISRRHHRTGKNQADGAPAVEHIPFRYLVAFVYPIAATVRPFLAKRGHGAEAVDRMHAAWTKAVLIQAILWSHYYVKDGDF